MKKVSVTYHAPPGDSKVVEMIGHTFFDGKPEDITVSDDLYEIISRNGNFKCGKAEDTDPTDAGSAKQKPSPSHPASQERAGSQASSHGGSEKK